MSVGWWMRATLAVGRKPGLWATALVVARRLVPTGWWRRRPFLPVPDRGYLRFRSVTAYGDPSREPDPDDLVAYLHWCRAWPHNLASVPGR